MILHFVIDGKLIDQIIENFMKVSDRNYFLVFSKVKQVNEFSRITYRGENIKIFDGDIESIHNLIDLIDVRAIVVHSLSPEYASIINRIEKPVVFCWIIWGYDVYSMPKMVSRLYGKRTFRYLMRHDPLIRFKTLINRSHKLRRFIYSVFKRREDNYSILLGALSKINYAATYILEDFEMLCKYYPNNIEFIVSAFSTKEQYLAQLESPSLYEDAANVLLGNSNSISSNYLDALSLLARNSNQLNKVYVVLSYGTDENHKRKILKAGSKKLKDHFVPLTEFIPRNEYIEILRTCSVGIFHHYRQRAMGNIIAMLYMGSRVYLSLKNPAYHYFIRKRIKVFSIEKDFSIFGLSKLEDQNVKANRDNLDKVFSEEKVISDLENLTNIITVN